MNQPARTARPPAAPALREQHVERITARRRSQPRPGHASQLPGRLGPLPIFPDREVTLRPEQGKMAAWPRGGIRLTVSNRRIRTVTR